jgi:hypothetical protein
MPMTPSISEDATVNEVSWDAMPKPMREYIWSMTVPPEGTVLQAEDGQPTYKLLRIPKATSQAEWTVADNARRCDLIEKDLDGQLTSQEQLELEWLESRLDRHVNKVAPLPLEQLRQLHKKVLEQAAQANGTSGS